MNYNISNVGLNQHQTSKNQQQQQQQHYNNNYNNNNMTSNGVSHRTHNTKKD